MTGAINFQIKIKKERKCVRNMACPCTPRKSAKLRRSGEIKKFRFLSLLNLNGIWPFQECACSTFSCDFNDYFFLLGENKASQQLFFAFVRVCFTYLKNTMSQSLGKIVFH